MWSGPANCFARQPFRHTQRGGEHVDGAALGSWAQNFPVENRTSPLAGTALTQNFPGRVPFEGPVDPTASGSPQHHSGARDVVT